MVQPTELHVNPDETERQRQFGILRAQQRAALPLINLLRDQREITHEFGHVTLVFHGNEATDIEVSQTTLNKNLLERVQGNNRKGE